jgi:hypothetical protein
MYPSQTDPWRYHNIWKEHHYLYDGQDKNVGVAECHKESYGERKDIEEQGR